MRQEPTTPELTPDAVEQELRAALAGRRLVFEAGLDEASFRRLRKPFFLAARTDPLRTLRLRYPALFVSYFACVGTFLYEGGTYWESVHPHLRVNTSDTGVEFLCACDKLGLERFDELVDEDGGLQWVSRILAHGGIPVSCTAPVADLVVHEVASGAPSGQELVALWRARKAGLPALHQPTRRFLLYGGSPASDLLDRCIELLRSRGPSGELPAPQAVGLPAHVVDAFSKVDETRISRASRRVQAGLPHPDLRIDPYTGLGPAVVLPAVPGDQLGATWRVSDGSSIGRYAPSAFAPTTVRVAPARSVEVEFAGANEEQRRWFFECLARVPALFFSPATGSIVRRVGSLALDEVWVLYPEAVELSVQREGGEGEPPDLVQQLPRPGGAWSGFVLEHLDLDGVRALAFEGSDGKAERVGISAPQNRPALDVEPVSGVSTPGGFPVFDALPDVRVPSFASLENLVWTVRLTTDGATQSADVTAESGRISLDGLVPGDGFGVHRLTVRGQLGMDLTTEFAVVPGLRVVRPPGAVMPGGDATVEVFASDAKVADGELGVARRVAPAEHESLVATSIERASGEHLDVVVRVPRLLWTIVHETKPAIEPRSAVARVGKEEFDDHLADLLLVSLGRSDITLQLELREPAGESLRTSETVVTAGRDGRWTFNLGPFSDLIRDSSAGRLEFRLHVGAHDIHVADVVAHVEVHRLTASTRVAGDFTEVVLRFEQERDVRDRVARLWSEHRPWAQPVVTAIPDGENEVSVSGYDVLPPGPYVAEIAVDDPWRTTTWPSQEGAGVRTLKLGTSEEIGAYLTSLDPDDPRSLITLALSGRFGETEFAISALASCADELAAALVHGLRDVDPIAVTPRAFQRVASIATARDHVLCAALLAAAEAGLADRQLVRISLRMIPLLDPVGDPVDDADMAALWRSVPIVAAAIDLPRVLADPTATDRCRSILGWYPGAAAPERDGAQVNQLLLAMERDQLREIRQTVGILPQRLLDPETLQCASFDWLIANDKTQDSDLRDWYFSYRHLLREAPTSDPDVIEGLKWYLASRMHPKGTEEWASIPAVTLFAAAHAVWDSTHADAARAALELVLPWASGLVVHDVLLAMVLHDSLRQSSSVQAEHADA